MFTFKQSRSRHFSCTRHKISSPREIESNITPEPILKRLRNAPRWKKLSALGIFIMVIITSLFGLIFYAGSIMDDAEIGIEGIRVTGGDQNTLSLEVDTLLKNPSSRSVKLEKTELDIIYQGTKAAYFKIPSMELKSGENHLSLQMELKEYQGQKLQDLVSDLLSSDNVVFTVKGDVRTKGFFSIKLPLEKEVSIKKSGDLEIDVEDISILTTDDEGIRAEVKTTITNPSIIETTLDGLGFDVLYNGSLMTTVSTSGYLSSGENHMNFSFLIPSDASETYNSLTSAIIKGEDCLFDIQGKYSNGLLLSRLSTEFNYNYILDFSVEVRASVTNITIRSLGLFRTTLGISVIVDNPTPISANLMNFEFSAFYQGKEIGDIQIQNPSIVPGFQTVDILLGVNTFSILGLGELVSSLLSGGEVELLIEGKRTFDPENTLIFYLITVL